MALTVANADSRSEDTWGRQRIRLVDVTFDASYDTGGESFTAADVGLAEITAVFATNAGGRVIDYDASAETLVVYGAGAANVSTEPLDEEDAAEDLSSFTARLLVVGR